jgi:hypothetical protein
MVAMRRGSAPPECRVGQSEALTVAAKDGWIFRQKIKYLVRLPAIMVVGKIK